MPSTTRRARRIARRSLGDRGSVTVEAAVGIGALVAVFGLVVAGVLTVAAQVSAVETAGAAAREHAIGGAAASPPRGRVEVTESGGKVTARAEIPAPFGMRRAQAVYPVEAGGTPQ
ncbi:hypothetical protein ACUY3L_10490 [Corynebacterium mastitidis]